jgi:hypothetical protein
MANAIKYERKIWITHRGRHDTFIQLGSKGPNRENYEHRYTRKTGVAQNDEEGCNHMRLHEGAQRPDRNVHS